MTLGQKLADLRKQKGLSQEELANVMAVSRQAVSKWENNLSSPDTANLLRLAELLEVDVNTFLCAEHTEPAESPTEDRQLKRLKRIIGILACGLVLAVCAAAMFACLWLLGEDSQSAPESTGTWQEALTFHQGLMHEEVDLTFQEKERIASYLSYFHFTKYEDTEDKDFIYGGRMYQIEYEKDGVRFYWYFSENQFLCTVQWDDGRQITHEYTVDYTLFYELDKYVIP